MFCRDLCKKFIYQMFPKPNINILQFLLLIAFYHSVFAENPDSIKWEMQMEYTKDQLIENSNIIVLIKIKGFGGVIKNDCDFCREFNIEIIEVLKGDFNTMITSGYFPNENYGNNYFPANNLDDHINDTQNNHEHDYFWHVGSNRAYLASFHSKILNFSFSKDEMYLIFPDLSYNQYSAEVIKDTKNDKWLTYVRDKIQLSKNNAPDARR
jgi:hypothetical protein